MMTAEEIAQEFLVSDSPHAVVAIRVALRHAISAACFEAEWAYAKGLTATEACAAIRALLPEGKP